ncbi:MAG: sugar kinase [Pseudomonadota bacterium]
MHPRLRPLDSSDASERSPVGSKAVLFGEAMIELSNITDRTADLGVAGDSFNTTIYMSRLGASVAYMTALGDDAFSDRVRARAEFENINTDLVATLPGQVVGAYAISLDERGERSFTYWRSASAARSFFRATNIGKILDVAKQADLLFLTGISLSIFDEKDRTRILGLLAGMRAAGACTAFDGNYRPACWQSIEIAREVIQKAVSLAQISLPTYEDEAELFGDTSPEMTVERHLDLGAREVVVKCGEHGALVSDHGWVRPERTVTPVDTTGAGDSFNGAYLAARMHGDSPADAAARGNQLAASVLGVKGAILPEAYDLQMQKSEAPE